MLKSFFKDALLWFMLGFLFNIVMLILLSMWLKACESTTSNPDIEVMGNTANVDVDVIFFDFDDD